VYIKLLKETLSKVQLINKFNQLQSISTRKYSHFFHKSEPNATMKLSFFLTLGFATFIMAAPMATEARSVAVVSDGLSARQGTSSCTSLLPNQQS
jgi:hypothetical protein